MSRKHIFGLVCIFLLLAGATQAFAQERVGPVNYNPFLNKGKNKNIAAKTTAASLPFFEDFTGYDVFPDNTKWLDREVYVNNTMCASPISRGVATFDALNERGMPYDTLNPSTVLYADSLTSVPINLSTHVPADSIYLSFFFQPAGLGFAPDAGDSLMLFFLQKNGVWTKMWAQDGSASAPFQQVLIPVTDTQFFYGNFQFRFVNIASIDLNDDIWNLDYIRMDAGRNMNDTAINDIAFSENPSFMLNDLTYMPYRQFLANANQERASQQTVNIRNNYGTARSVVFTEVATSGATTLATFTNSSVSIAPYSDQPLTAPVYTNTVPIGGQDDKVIFNNKFYINATPAGEPKDNDTIVQQQIFDNYLAYDDGTAEKSYFLNLFPTLPGKIAIEYNLNQPDTVRGVAIYFGRQVPTASSKFFSAEVYSSITPNSPAETVVYEEDLLQPSYADTVNHFWYYRFQTPVAMPAGVFYMGVTQPALSGSDSLYIGLDVNRISGNHAYYNVLDQWVSSSISGALMIRPILGQDFTGTSVKNIFNDGRDWVVYPNPAQESIAISLTNNTKPFNFEISDMEGRIVERGSGTNGQTVNINNLVPGVYLVRLLQNGLASIPKKIIKL